MRNLVNRIRNFLGMGVSVRLMHPVYTPCKSGQRIAYVVASDVPTVDGRGRSLKGTNQIQAHRTSGQPDHGGYVIEFQGKTAKGGLDATSMTKITLKKGDIFYVTLTGESVTKQAVTVY